MTDKLMNSYISDLLCSTCSRTRFGWSYLLEALSVVILQSWDLLVGPNCLKVSCLIGPINTNIHQCTLLYWMSLGELRCLRRTCIHVRIVAEYLESMTHRQGKHTQGYKVRIASTRQGKESKVK